MSDFKSANDRWLDFAVRIQSIARAKLEFRIRMRQIAQIL